MDNPNQMVNRAQYVKLIKSAYEKGHADCKAGKYNPPNLGGRKTSKNRKHTKKSRKHRK
jgi:hypothetical protein